MHRFKFAVSPRLVASWLSLAAAACSSSSTSATPDAAPVDGNHVTPTRDSAADHHVAADTGHATNADTGKPDAGGKVDATVDASKGMDAGVESGAADAHPKPDGHHQHDAPTRETGVDGGHDAIVDAPPDVPTGPVPFFDGGPGCTGPDAVGPSGEPKDLKCTGLYPDWEHKDAVAPDLKAYTPGLQLWSDGALKHRWISLPPGTQIDTTTSAGPYPTTTMDEWTFPVGTRIFKEFNLPTSESDGGLRRIETRLIWKLPGGWYLTTYQWTADGETDATELTAGMLDANGLGYEIPTQQQCSDCHKGRIDYVMGFEAVSLAQPLAEGFAMPQLLEAGLLTTPPEPGSLTIPGDPTAAAGLGFLHVNCGLSCHTPNGAASNSQFFMRLDVATLGSVQETDTWTTGWNVPSGFAIPGVASPEELQACSLGTSAAYYYADNRVGVGGFPEMESMPPIDTHVVDVAGMQVLAAWINEGCDAGVADGGVSDASTDH